jgi:hypothetical protein
MNRRKIVLFGKKFNPASITGLKYWYDASKITGLVDGDACATWTDLGSPKDDLTAAAGARPTYKVAVKNGRAILRFDGAANIMVTGVFAADLAQPNTIFCVFSSDNSSPFGASAQVYDSAVSSNTKRHVLFALNAVGTQWSSYSGSVYTPGPTVSAGWYISTALYNGAASTIRLNGALLAAAGAAGAQAMGSLNVGGYNALTGWWDGDIAELLIYNANVSSINVGDIERYLSRKWGIAIA